MSEYTIIDRRVNPTGKNLSNRQRFLQRARNWIKEKVRQSANDRQITSDDGESISIVTDDISEPNFGYDYHTGDWDRVLPGNKDFIKGDILERPAGGGKGSGGDASDGDDGTDEFVFTISKEEYLDILFEDLELPDLVKESEDAAVLFARRRSGYSTTGTPNNLDLEKSLKNALGRRIALRLPLDKIIKKKEQEIKDEVDEEKASLLEAELFKLKSRRSAISYIDQVDVRYRRFTNVPLPSSQAVVFCLMDISGSMGEKEKEIAKRFFLLLYLFLQRKYQKVDIRFVRHTTTASECTEEEFFRNQLSGGTVVSSGVKKVDEIVRAEYPLDYWNVYVVQASDGDNFTFDDDTLEAALEGLIPICQHYVYNEVIHNTSRKTNVRATMEKLSEFNNNLSLINIGDVNDVVETFREIFSKKTPHVK